LEGEVVAVSYVVDRMLAEFAAAAVNFSRAIEETYQEEGQGEDEEEDGIRASEFAAGDGRHGQGKSLGSISLLFQLLGPGHKHFIWTGPKLQIHPISADILSILPLLTVGERLDLPSCPIYGEILDSQLPSSPDVQPVVGKRRDQDSPSPSKPCSGNGSGCFDGVVFFGNGRFPTHCFDKLFICI
jgi:hypothetical protein